MIEIILFVATLILAFANGANDNFKGFATVWGSKTLTYQRALWLASTATLLGGIVSLFFAQALLKTFSGKGLVPDVITTLPAFAPSVAIAAGLTILLATRFGFPVSTTHAMLGALLGAGLVVASEQVQLAHLASAFLAPLLLSPVVAGLTGWALAKRRRNVSTTETCVCVVNSPIESAIVNEAAFDSTPTSVVIMASVTECRTAAPLVTLRTSTLADTLHVFSAAAICFARGVNDTPKLVALLLMAQLTSVPNAIAMIAVAMVVGGLVFARGVATTMSQRLSTLNHRSGLTANLITTILVLGASKFGLPVSTTHVAVGAIAGVGQGSNAIDRHVLRNILLSWLATLPTALVLAYFFMTFIK